MAALTTIAAVAALVVGTASYVSAEKSRKEAQANYNAQSQQQSQARSEQQAVNAQQAAQERRQQVREERVRRARLLQAAENTGTEGSSGEIGAAGGFATQLGANLGSNLGTLAATGRINQFSQSAADFGSRAQQSLNNAASSQNLFGLSSSIFNAAGGFSSVKSLFNSPLPKT